MEIQKKKKQLRKDIVAVRDAMGMEMRQQKDEKIADTLTQQAVFLQAETVFLFANFGSEVSTAKIIEAGINSGKTVGLPRIDGKSMEFYAVTSMEDLEIGVWGILEPKKECALLDCAQLIVMPGVAFDEAKNRLGYGGGYYDRYLDRCRTQWNVFPVLAAIAYEEQIVSRVPATPQDVTPDMVITDKRIL